MVRERNLTPLAVVTVATLAYFGFGAALVLNAVSRGAIGSGFDSSVQTAIAWGVAEMIAVLVPFFVTALVMSIRPNMLPRNIWIAPLAAVVLPITLSAMWNLFAIGSLTPDFYIGGALAPEAAVPAQLAAALMGSAMIAITERVRPATVRS